MTTRGKRLRRSIDLVLASHHHFGPKMGLRRLSRRFGIPRSTVRDALRRVERDDPELRRVAIEWGHLRLTAHQLGPIILRDGLRLLPGLEDIAEEGGTSWIG